jgi:hypothetical protein
MTTLFDRRVTVTIGTIEFTALDCSFTIEKSLAPEPNTCHLTIWNLSEDSQGQLEQLKPTEKQAKTGIPCRIEAGYKEGTSLIWLGDLRTVETTRDGPDWVTHLTSGDGEKAWQHARNHVAYGPKTPIEVALRSIARSLGVGEGNLGKVVQRLKVAGSAIWPAGKVLSGAASRQLIDIARSADLEVSIQDGALQFLDRGQALAGQAVRLSHETGLIGSPSVDSDGVLTATMLMIPDIRPGVVVVVDAVRVKGNYRAEKVTWRGDTTASEWYVEIEAKRY